MTCSNNRKMILAFETHKSRELFFGKNSLEKHRIDEDTMGTKTDCAVECPNEEAMEEISRDAMGLNATVYKDCGGVGLKACSEFESSNGSICDFCQYCEFE